MTLLIGLNDLNAFTPVTADPVAQGSAQIGAIITETLTAAQTVVTLGGVDAIILYTSRR